MPPFDTMQNPGSIIPDKFEELKDLMPTERKSMWRTAEERRMSDLTRVMEWMERRRSKKLLLVQSQLQKQAQAQPQPQPQAQPQPQEPKVCTGGEDWQEGWVPAVPKGERGSRPRGEKAGGALSREGGGGGEYWRTSEPVTESRPCGP